MNAYVFPGQGAQFPGMGKDLFDQSDLAKGRFAEANDVLGFDIASTMFEGTPEALKQTNVTQPAIFIHSVVLAECLGARFQPDMVAGHSLGEFSALVAAGSLSFEDGLQLVSARANAMQEACELQPSTMAAVLGLDNSVVETICKDTQGVVVAANYNCPGQLVISGEVPAVEAACAALSDAGARRALMEPAREKLAQAIESAAIEAPRCTIYQNVSAEPTVDPGVIRTQLVAQLTAPVRWTQTMHAMISDGATNMTEVGPGKVLQGLFKKVDRAFPTSSASLAMQEA